MKDEYLVLENILKRECGSGPVFYLPNPGNWGDALIRHGTLKFFQDINLEYKEISKKDAAINKKHWHFPFKKRATLIYGGGGAWCKLWNGAPNLVNKLKLKFKVIVLPSTYESTYSFKNTIFFRRDDFESKTSMPDAHFCHDMAFYLANEIKQSNHGSGEGFFFRTDKESSNRFKLTQQNNDLSSKGNHLKEVSSFFNEIDSFAQIHTDRLHISIAACLLGKEVHIYPGAYFKNRAVYLSSIKNHFNNAYYHENLMF
jgi:exopolysaccharide biosynthesis predicted pyruvyltransferase EpsI